MIYGNLVNKNWHARATKFLLPKKTITLCHPRARFVFFCLENILKIETAKKDGSVVFSASEMTNQIPAQVFIGSLGELFYPTCISQFHFYKLKIMFLYHLGNALILVRYLDAIKEDLGKACAQSNYKSPKRQTK